MIFHSCRVMQGQTVICAKLRNYENLKLFCRGYRPRGNAFHETFKNLRVNYEVNVIIQILKVLIDHVESETAAVGSERR